MTLPFRFRVIRPFTPLRLRTGARLSITVGDPHILVVTRRSIRRVPPNFGVLLHLWITGYLTPL